MPKKEEKKSVKIIGWTTYDEYEFNSGSIGLLDYGGDKETDEAVIEDIKKHGYLFNGYDHQEFIYCVPVTDDYRMIRYSQRHFGFVMASAWGNPKNAPIYSFNFALKSEAKVFPSHKLTVENNIPPKSDFDLNKDIFNEIYALPESFEEGCDCQNIYLFPVPLKKDSFYWLSDIITLNCEDKKIFTVIKYLLSEKNYEEFKKHMETRKGYSEYVKYFYNEEYIKSIAGDKPFLLLGLRNELKI